MPYKDSVKQKEANRLASKRSRERKQGMTEVIPCVTPEKVIPSVIPKTDKELLAFWSDGGGSSEQCMLGRLAHTYDVIKGYI